jgi:peptide/nickel transport system ATP-binding protein
MQEPSMLSVDRVSKVFKLGAFGGKELTAVRDVSFELHPGEVVSLIGESGSGKTTVGKMILRLTAVTDGAIRFDDRDIGTLRGKALKSYHRDVQGVFQDPFSSFNPVFRADHVFEMIRDEFFPDVRGPAWKAKVVDALEAVTLNPDEVLRKYPHQLSGGQLQRMLIARALLLDIRILVADEIISMLDASTRIDVLNLLADLKQRGLGILFITHDLSLGNYISERTLILYQGRIVEMGNTERVFGNPCHPYTRKLVTSVPQLHEKWSDVDVRFSGPSAVCPYHQGFSAGAAVAAPSTNGSAPALVEIEPDHLVGCAGDGCIDANGHRRSA